MQLTRIILSVLLLAAGVATLFVAFQSGATSEVIDNSLARHVKIFLLEEATYGLVMNELRSQNNWLWVSGSALIVAALAVGIPAKK